MSEHTTQTQAFKLKGRLYTFTVLSVLNTNIEFFSQQLADTINKAPKLFDHTPIVLDLSGVQHLDFDLQDIVQVIRAHGMIPLAIQGGTSRHHAFAQCHGLAILHASSTQDKPLLMSFDEPHHDMMKTTGKLLTTPVRSGQQVVAKGTDLIVASSVSHGAELLADGCIHVYGALRGRALAGISGDKEARIFCQSLEAELVSIAGFYRLSDAIESCNKPCQIYLLDEHIHIEPL